MKFAFAALATLVVLAAACFAGSGSKPITEEHFYDNFKTVVATAGQDGYTPYWLGRGFQAAGLEFRGPFADNLLS